MKGVYLKSLPQVPVARYSAGSRRRAAQLQAFLRLLKPQLAPIGDVTVPQLLVLSKTAWRQLSSIPYESAHLRTKKPGLDVLVPAAYPERFLHRFDDLLLKAGQSELKIPGELSEFLDLLVAETWLLGVVKRSGLGTRLAWLDELSANYLFLLCLEGAGLSDLAGRLRQWWAVELAGGEPVAINTTGRRLGFARRRWIHGCLGLRAAELSTSGWAFGLALQQAAKPSNKVAMLQVLITLEPGFESWLMELEAGETVD